MRWLHLPIPGAILTGSLYPPQKPLMRSVTTPATPEHNPGPCTHILAPSLVESCPCSKRPGCDSPLSEKLHGWIGEKPGWQVTWTSYRSSCDPWTSYLPKSSFMDKLPKLKIVEAAWNWLGPEIPKVDVQSLQLSNRQSAQNWCHTKWQPPWSASDVIPFRWQRKAQIVSVCCLLCQFQVLTNPANCNIF